jgi:hypothetical protein
LNKKYRAIPNATLQGHTFDVRHLDKFIGSGVGASGAPYGNLVQAKNTGEIVQ